MRNLLLGTFAALLLAISPAMAFTAGPSSGVVTSLEPFLSFGEMNGTYQGSGWVKGKVLVGCHMIEEEGTWEECSISTGDFVDVRQTPNGRVIGSLTNGVPILVSKRQDNWVEMFTYCPDNLVPMSTSHDGVRLYSCEERPK